MQRRLSDAEVDELAKRYIEGTSIDALARVYRVHRTTVIGHLDRRQIPRRRVVRKMIDRTVEDAAAAYGRGDSLATVALRFGVDARTLRREFEAHDVPTRRRRGRPP